MTRSFGPSVIEPDQMPAAPSGPIRGSTRWRRRQFGRAPIFRSPGSRSGRPGAGPPVSIDGLDVADRGGQPGRAAALRDGRPRGAPRHGRRRRPDGEDQPAARADQPAGPDVPAGGARALPARLQGGRVRRLPDRIGCRTPARSPPGPTASSAFPCCAASTTRSTGGPGCAGRRRSPTCPTTASKPGSCCPGLW